MRFPVVHRIYLVPAAGLVLALAMTACSSSSSSSSSSASAPATTSPSASPSASASSTASDVSQIKSNWQEFFASKTPNSKRVQLLQNGSEFASAISAFSASPLASAVSSKVDSVTVTSGDQAKVKYDLTAGGQSVASGQTGTAVRQDGVWKVGDGVFCGLLKEGSSLLNIKVPAACNSAS